jgi:hypothetical protein
MTEKAQEATGSGSDSVTAITQAAHIADERLEQLTGRSGSAWLKTGEHFARTHPIQSALVVLSAMYLVKKFR